MTDSCAAPDRAHCQPSDLTHVAESPDVHSQPSQLARIAKFEFCSADPCPMRSTERTHLLVSKSQIDLFKERNAAVALSYTWGQFEHTQRLIGHAVDGEPVSLILGAEWDTEDITSCLVRLSFEHGGCWMDQLCMPQKGTELRRALASIPLIYRSLDVVVLLPGAPCKCLQESLDMIKIAEDFGTQEDFVTAQRTAQKQIFHCLNFMPSCSWFKRLWTRQEMLYSTRISVAWTGLGTAQCIKVPDIPSESTYLNSVRVPPEQISNLAPFARLLYQRTSKENYDLLFGHTGWSALKHAFQIGTPSAFANSMAGLAVALVDKISSLPSISENLRQKVNEGRETIEGVKAQWAQITDTAGAITVEVDHILFVYEAIATFRDYMAKNENNVAEDVFLVILHFFSGKSITNMAMELDTQDEEGRLTRFLKNLATLRSSRRSCTQPRDYVNSVWVDCPGFQIPKSHNEMKLSALLEDALNQLRANHGVEIVTTAPSGLFSATASTGSWKPSQCLRDKVENAEQVYQPVIYPVDRMPITKEGMIPLRLTGRGLSSLSITAFDYEREWSRRPTMFIFNELINIMQWWSTDALWRLGMLKGFDEVCGKMEAADTAGLNLVGRVHGTARAIASGVVGGYNTYRNAMAANMERNIEEIHERREINRDSRAFERKLMQAVDNRRKFMPDSEQWTSQRELKHTEIVYSMVANAMGLDYDICRRHGLKLMVSRDPPCIGLTNQDILAIQKRQKWAIRTVRVSTRDPRGVMLYEVAHVKGDPKTEKYRVFGVWVPMMIMPREIHDRVYAVATKEATDAFIG